MSIVMFDNEQQRGRSPKPKVQCSKSFGRGWFTLMPPWAPKRRRDAQPNQVKPSQGRSRLVKVKRPTIFMKMTSPGRTAASVRGRPVSRCIGIARYGRNASSQPKRSIRKEARRVPVVCVGSTGDPPVPFGDSPHGTEATPRSNRKGPFAKRPARFRLRGAGDVKLCKVM